MISARIRPTKGFIVWAEVDWAEQGSLCSLIVVKKKKAEQAQVFNSSSMKWCTSKFLAEIITQGAA